MSSIAHQQGVLGSDYRTEEVLAASFIAASIPVWIFILIGISRLGVQAEGVQIEKGDVEQAVEVTPMIDYDHPVLKGGGKKVKLPDAWAPPPEPRREAAVASPDAKDDPGAIPDPNLPVYDGGTAPNPDGGTTTDPDASMNPPTGEGGGSPDGGESGGDGDGGSPGSKDGNTDDRLLARAARLYRGRLTSFFKAGFRCPKLPEGAQKCSPTGSASISGLTVTSVSFQGCGVAEIDAAARAALQSKQGQQIPPPPEEYKEKLTFSSFPIQYQCK